MRVVEKVLSLPILKAREEELRLALQGFQVIREIPASDHTGFDLLI